MNTTTQSIARILFFSLIAIGSLIYLTQCTDAAHSQTIMIAGSL